MMHSLTVVLLSSLASTWAIDPCSITNAVETGEVEDDAVQEASGLAAGRRNSGMLFTHNDSGDEANLFAFHEDGKPVGESFTLNWRQLKASCSQN